MGVHWKIWVLDGALKKQYVRQNYLKRVDRAGCRFKGGLAKYRDW